MIISSKLDVASYPQEVNPKKRGFDRTVAEKTNQVATLHLPKKNHFYNGSVSHKKKPKINIKEQVANFDLAVFEFLDFLKNETASGSVKISKKSLCDFCEKISSFNLSYSQIKRSRIDWSNNYYSDFLDEIEGILNVLRTRKFDDNIRYTKLLDNDIDLDALYNDLWSHKKEPNYRPNEVESDDDLQKPDEPLLISVTDPSGDETLLASNLPVSL